jgi:hypothetical protein
MSYICKNDICLPRDLAQVGIFKGLQRAINDVLDASRVTDTGPINPKLGLYIDKLVVDGKIGPKTVMTTMELALNIESIRHAFRGVIYDTAGVAAAAGPLGKAFAYVAAVSYKPAAVPEWLWPASPPVALVWARRSYK